MGRFAINPLNGEEVPIYAGNFVVASYGTGAAIAVPGHDQRDYDSPRNTAFQLGRYYPRQEAEAIEENPAFDGFQMDG